MNDFDDFGGCLANSDFQEEDAYYMKQINSNTSLSIPNESNTISGGMAVAVFKNIKDSRFSYDEKMAAIGYVLSMPTYNSIYKNDFRDAVDWLYHQVK